MENTLGFMLQTFGAAVLLILIGSAIVFAIRTVWLVYENRDSINRIRDTQSSYLIWRSEFELLKNTVEELKRKIG